MPNVPTPPATARPSAALWAMAGHDFSQPLQAFELLAAALTDEPDQNARRQIRIRMDAARRSLWSMLQHLTQIAAFEVKPGGPALTPCPLDQLLSGVAAELQPVAAHRGGSITMTPCGLSMPGSRPLLDEVVKGLAMFAFWLDPTAQVTLRGRQHGNHSLVEIDTAAALPPSIASRLFVELPITVGGEPALAVGFSYDLVQHAAALLALEVQTAASPAGGTLFTIEPV